MAGPSTDFENRFIKRVYKTASCWLWQGQLNFGYGRMRVNKGKRIFVHRFAWTLYNGPIPEKMLVCHKCDVRNCVNPEHLFLGTHKDNTQDMHRKKRHWNQNTYKTHCLRGHPFDDKNTIKRVTGGRRCRECVRILNEKNAEVYHRRN